MECLAYGGTEEVLSKSQQLRSLPPARVSVHVSGWRELTGPALLT